MGAGSVARARNCRRLTGGLAAAVLPALPAQAHVVGGSERLETLPEIDAGGWLGILGPAGMAPDVVNKLNEAINASLRHAGTRDALKQLGFIPRPQTPRAFADFLRDEIARWPPIIAAAGMEKQ